MGEAGWEGRGGRVMRSPAPLPLTLTPQWSCLLPLCLEALPTSRLAMRSQVRGQMGQWEEESGQED